MNTTVTTLVILIASVVLGIGVVLYGSTLFNASNSTIYQDASEMYNCKNGKSSCVIQFDYTVYDIGTLQNSSLSLNNMHIMNFVPISDNMAYVSNGNDEFMLIPNYHGIVYFFVNSTNGFFDPIETQKQNPFIKKFSFGDPLGIGRQGWVMQVNVSRSDSNWISTGPSASDYAVGIKTKFTIPITVVVHTNETDVKIPIISTELHKKGETGQLWWTDVNGTYDCKVYRYQSGGDGFYSYSYNGVGCSDYQAHKFDKVQYAMDHPSNEQLTEGTNVCTVGFDCPRNESKYYSGTPEIPTLTEATNCQEPCNTSSALIEGTEMQMLLGKIQDQNKKILENQNIMMCLEVVKSQYNWEEIGKYLTQRGVNCTGLEIK